MTKTKKILADDERIGKRIRVFRELNSMPRVALAEKLNITHQQLAKYEHGIDRISAGKLLVVSKALQVKINRFFENIEDSSDIKNDDFLLSFIRSYTKIKDEKTKILINSLIRRLSIVYGDKKIKNKVG